MIQHNDNAGPNPYGPLVRHHETSRLLVQVPARRSGKGVRLNHAPDRPLRVLPAHFSKYPLVGC